MKSGVWKKQLPVVLFLAADLEAVIKREGLVSVPVRQLYAEGILSLTGQLVNVLVSQPVLRSDAPKALRQRERSTIIKQKIIALHNL